MNCIYCERLILLKIDTVGFMDILWYDFHCGRISIRAVVAEWLRRLTRNQIPSGSVGSNPTDCEIFLIAKYCFNIDFYFDLIPHVSIVGSVVECSPATRAARVRFPDDAVSFFSVHTVVIPTCCCLT